MQVASEGQPRLRETESMRLAISDFDVFIPKLLTDARAYMIEQLGVS